MMKKATIIRIDEGVSYAVTGRKGSCGSKCDTCKHKCHNNDMEMKIDRDDYFLGQEIEIDVEENATMLWLFLLYGVSLIVFFLSIFLVEYLKSIYSIDTEAGPIIFGVVSMVLYWVILSKIKNRFVFYKIKG